ncbi:PTS sugar transporter subunit IIA, partial [Halalkalibacterium halodurans]|nr:PTS sugar transporter subunit IIA [Halalkalibacterium halodurans]
GTLLVEKGYVEPNYVDKMFERETVTSTYLGNYLAIPHGTEEAKEQVIHSGMSVLVFDDPVDWDGQEVRVVIGIAGKGTEHLDILSKIAITFSEEENVERLLSLESAQEVLAFLGEVNE